MCSDEAFGRVTVVIGLGAGGPDALDLAPGGGFGGGAGRALGPTGVAALDLAAGAGGGLGPTGVIALDLAACAGGCLGPTGVAALDLAAGAGWMAASVIANIGPVVLALAFATWSAGACRFKEGPVVLALVFAFWSAVVVAGRFLEAVDDRVCFSVGPGIISATRFLEGNGG